MDLNGELLKQVMQKGQDFASDIPQVRVGIIGRAMRLIGNHMHFRAIQE